MAPEGGGLGLGTPVRGTPGKPGDRERVDFGEVIGEYVDPASGQRSRTTKGIVHYSSRGAHIVPAPLNARSMITERTRILLTLQQALLGAVTPALRGVTAGWEPGGDLTVTCYFDGDISETDEEAMEDLDTELLAGFDDRKIALELLRCDAPAPMAVRTAWVYRRHEG